MSATRRCPHCGLTQLAGPACKSCGTPFPGAGPSTPHTSPTPGAPPASTAAHGASSPAAAQSDAPKCASRWPTPARLVRLVVRVVGIPVGGLLTGWWGFNVAARWYAAVRPAWLPEEAGYGEVFVFWVLVTLAGMGGMWLSLEGVFGLGHLARRAFVAGASRRRRVATSALLAGVTASVVVLGLFLPDALQPSFLGLSPHAPPPALVSRPPWGLESAILDVNASQSAPVAAPEAEAAYAAGRFGEAAAAYRAAYASQFRAFLTQSPAGQGAPSFELAYAYLLAGELEVAEAWAREASTQETMRSDSLYILGHVHRRRGELRQAAAAFEQAWRRDRRQVGAAMSWATSLVLLGELGGARQAFHRAVSSDTYASAMTDYLGLLEALDGLTQQARTSPEDAQVQATLATALWYLVIYDPSQLAACDQAARTALRRQPEHPDALIALAAMARRRNDLRAAEELYRRAVTADPRHAYGWRMLAFHLSKRGQREEALAAYRKASALDPSEPFYLDGEVSVLWDLGRFKEMTVAAEKLVALEPRDADNWSHLGDAYHASGRLEDAKAAYLRSLEYNAAQINALHHLAFISKQQKRTEDAIRYYLVAISLNADRPGVYVELGDILREEGWLTDSVKVLERGVAQFPEHGDLHAALCDTYRAMAKEEEAQRECARGRALNRSAAKR